MTARLFVSLTGRPLEAKRHELSTPKSVDMFMSVPRHALILKSEGQGHMVMNCAAGVGINVDTNA